MLFYYGRNMSCYNPWFKKKKTKGMGPGTEGSALRGKTVSGVWIMSAAMF